MVTSVTKCAQRRSINTLGKKAEMMLGLIFPLLVFAEYEQYENDQEFLELEQDWKNADFAPDWSFNAPNAKLYKVRGSAEGVRVEGGGGVRVEGGGGVISGGVRSVFSVIGVVIIAVV